MRGLFIALRSMRLFAFLYGLCIFLNSVAMADQLSSPVQTKKNDALTLAGDVIAGKIKSEDERCQECHGSDGNGEGVGDGAAGKFAKLAGQYPDYMLKQIDDFRSGKRKHDFMAIMAKNLNDTDAIDIIAYFASQKKMKGPVNNANSMGKNLFLVGDISRNILPCATCHGENGEGVDSVVPHAPVIGGQDWSYLERQLQDWRSGARNNSVGNVMNAVTKSLNDAEVKALADYISGL